MKQFLSPKTLKKTIFSTLVAGAIISFFRIYFMGEYELCVDSFYHVTIADLGYEFYTAKTFPHMTMSIWRDCFSDKELLFHLLLSVLRGIERLFKYSNTPPYHFPAIVFSLFFLFAFAFSATCLGVKRVCLFSILLILTSPFFTYRLGMLRPHVFGLSIILLSLPLFRYSKNFLGYLGIFFISFIYAWSYSQPHFILFPALAFSISRWSENKKICVYLVALALLGILCGYTIHPQFPNTFIIWKVQCVDLPIQLLFSNIPVYVGEELFRPNIKWIISNSAPIILSIFTSLGIFIFARKKSCGELPIELKAMFFLSTFSLLGLFFSKRFLEYGVPFSFMYAGIFIAKKIDLELWGKLNARKRIYLKTASYAILSIYVLNAVNSCIKLYSPPAARPYNDFADWTRKIGLPAGTVIANLNWSEFPMLFNSAPEYRYLVGIEPMFGYAYDPEKMKQIELIRTGQDMLHPNKLKELLNTNFAFVSYIDPWLAKNMYLSGYAIVYQGIDGWVFDLNRYMPEQHPKTTKSQ